MKRLLALILLLSALAAAPAFAVPALDRTVVRVQPDGSRVELRLRGDEFGSWYEGADGAAVVRSQSGRYDFAKKDANGSLISSGVKYSAGAARPTGAVRNYKPQASAAATRLRGARSVSSALAGSSGWHSRPVEGDRNLMVVLVSFQNAQIAIPSGDHMRSVWDEGDSAMSVRQYYKEQSHGKLNIVSADYGGDSGGPFGLIEITMTSADVYSGDHPDRYLNNKAMKSFINSHLNECAVVQNIIEKVADKYSIDFSEFDKDGDGEISQKELCFYMIFGGYEESFGGYIDGLPMVWAHAWSSWANEEQKHQVNIDGKLLTDWAMQGELGYAVDQDGRAHDTLLPGVGLMTHELGHQMCKLPDLYDVSNKNSGIGVYSVMGAGNWGAASGEIVGARPTNLDAWSRIYLGWETPTKMTASKSGANTTFRKAGTAPSGGIVRIESPALDCSAEYILAEVRDLTSKWDAGLQYVGGYNATGLAGGALLLLHVDESVGVGTLDKGNDFNSSANPHQGVMPIAPDCDYRTKATQKATNMWYSGNKYVDSFGSEIGDFVAGRTYFYGGKAKYSAERRSGIALRGFSAPGDAMTAVVCYDEADEDEESPANPVEPVIDDRTTDLIATFAPGVMPSKSLAASILASTDMDLASDDLTYDEAHQVTLTKQAVMRAAPGVVGVYPLPVFENVVSTDKNSLAFSFVVASADLLAKTPAEVQLLKVTGKQSSKFFTYTDDADDFIKDGYFTIQTNDDTGTVVSGNEALEDDYYRVTLFLKDDGSFDLNKTDNMVLDPAAIVAIKNSGKGSGGCSAEFGGLAALLAIALIPAARGRKK